MVCVFTWLGYRGLFHHSSGYCLFGHFFILFVLIWFRQVNHTHADPSLWTTIWVLWNLGLVCFFFLLLVVERNWYFYAINWAKAFKMLNNYIVFKIYIINIYIYIYFYTFERSIHRILRKKKRCNFFKIDNKCFLSTKSYFILTDYVTLKTRVMAAKN